MPRACSPGRTIPTRAPRRSTRSRSLDADHAAWLARNVGHAHPAAACRQLGRRAERLVRLDVDRRPMERGGRHLDRPRAAWTAASAPASSRAPIATGSADSALAVKRFVGAHAHGERCVGPAVRACGVRASRRERVAGRPMSDLRAIPVNATERGTPVSRPRPRTAQSDTADRRTHLEAKAHGLARP